jgi:hypothetical protein
MNEGDEELGELWGTEATGRELESHKQLQRKRIMVRSHPMNLKPNHQHVNTSPLKVKHFVPSPTLTIWGDPPKKHVSFMYSHLI